MHSVMPSFSRALAHSFRGIVGYMMEHEDVIKIPVNIKELQGKIKHAHTKLTQVQQSAFTALTALHSMGTLSNCWS